MAGSCSVNHKNIKDQLSLRKMLVNIQIDKLLYETFNKTHGSRHVCFENSGILHIRIVSPASGQILNVRCRNNYIMN